MTEQIIAQRLGIALRQVQGTVRLLRDGATIPFISRYRKEATGSLDELQVGAVKEQLDKLTELEARKQTVLSTIGEQGKLTDELRKRIEACWEAVELEDIYLPYKPKRRTRATVARERGLEPLANSIMAQNSHDIARQAQRFVTAENLTHFEHAGSCTFADDCEPERIHHLSGRIFVCRDPFHYALFGVFLSEVRNGCEQVAQPPDAGRVVAFPELGGSLGIVIVRGDE